MVSGYIVLLSGSLLSWKSKKQHNVSLSSAEIKYHSLHKIIAELAWLSYLLDEIEVPDILPISI